MHCLEQCPMYKEHAKVTHWICHNDLHLCLVAKLTYFEECNFQLEQKYFLFRSSSANIRVAVSVVSDMPFVTWLPRLPSSAGLIRGLSPMRRRPFRMLLTQEVGYYVRKYRRRSSDRFPCIIAYSSLGQKNKGSARLHITIALATYISHCKKTQWKLKCNVTPRHKNSGIISPSRREVRS